MMTRRLPFSLVAALPGLALAMFAKPFLLGEFALWLGLLFAIVLPIAYLVIGPLASGPKNISGLKDAATNTTAITANGDGEEN